MKTIKSKFYMLPVIALLMLISACNNESGKDDGFAQMNIYLTDAPAEYDAVNIDIQAVELITDEGTISYDLLHPGVYNLLQFNSGIDTLMISEEISPRTISQIRLILGENNSVVVDGMTYPLETPSAQSSGLKINVHYTFEAGIVYNLWLDFDAAKSIVEQGSGDYLLKPVIRMYTEAESGGISGNIAPLGSAIYVSAITPTDTVGTTINEDGSFLIGGLVTGTYDIQFSAAVGFSDITVPSVAVSNGSITDIGIITIPL